MNDSWKPSKIEHDTVALIKEEQSKKRRGLHETEIIRLVNRAYPELYTRTDINDAIVVLAGKKFLKKEIETQRIPAIKNRYTNKIDVPARTHKLELYSVSDRGILYLREKNGEAPQEQNPQLSKSAEPQKSSVAVNTGTLEALHEQIQNKCSGLYLGGYYPEAVEKGFKVVRDKLRDLTSHETGSEAFGKGGLFINGASAKNVEHDFQEAVKFLTMAIDQFRNEKSHTSDGKIEDPVRAYEYLALSSLAMHLLDDSEVKIHQGKPKLSTPSQVKDKQAQSNMTQAPQAFLSEPEATWASNYGGYGASFRIVVAVDNYGGKNDYITSIRIEGTNGDGTPFITDRFNIENEQPNHPYPIPADDMQILTAFISLDHNNHRPMPDLDRDTVSLAIEFRSGKTILLPVNIRQS